MIERNQIWEIIAGIDGSDDERTDAILALHNVDVIGYDKACLRIGELERELATANRIIGGKHRDCYSKGCGECYAIGHADGFKLLEEENTRPERAGNDL